MTIERAVHATDYTSELAWQLCAWCHAQGADTFSLEVLGTAPRGDVAYAKLVLPIQPFALQSAVRERLVARSGEPFVRPAELWSLTRESLSALLALFPDGLFHYPFGADAWPEDLTLYRDGQLILGIISHE